MRQKQAFFSFLLILSLSLQLHLKAQDNAPNLIVITTDGLRWQEVFNGMDFALANHKKFNHGDSAYLYNKYGSISVTERQTKLLPFFWQSIAKKGLLFGNRFKEK